MRPLRAALLALVAVSASAQPYTLDADVRYHQAAGVDPDLLSLDVYRPLGAGPFPVVVFVHGGGWHTGDKRSAVHAKADWLTARGVLFVSVNYRLSPTPQATPDPGRVTLPTHAQDVARAVAFVRANAERWDADPGRLALMGHSAGAHLATLVAMDARHLADGGGPAGCVVALDTNGYDVPYYLSLGPGASQVAIYENAFTADPGAQAAASPITYAGDAPGTEVLLVRQATAERAATTGRFRDALSGAGYAVSEVVADGLSHAEINRQLGTGAAPAFDAAVAAVLDRCLARPTDAASGPEEPGGGRVAQPDRRPRPAGAPGRRGVRRRGVRREGAGRPPGAERGRRGGLGRAPRRRLPRGGPEPRSRRPPAGHRRALTRWRTRPAPAR